MNKRYTDEQIAAFLAEAARGRVSIKALCRRHGFSDSLFYQWRRRFGGAVDATPESAAPAAAGEEDTAS